MIELIQTGGLRVNARPDAIYSFFIIWALLMLGAYYVLGYAWGAALLAGLLATAIHWLSEAWHHVGHWLAGKRLGYPMNGLTFVYALAIGRYPNDEPALPAEFHIQRALGGPLASLLLTLASGLMAYGLWPRPDLAAHLAAFTFMDNLLVFTLGALLPLGFTDGSTLLYWWPRRGR